MNKFTVTLKFFCIAVATLAFVARYVAARYRVRKQNGATSRRDLKHEQLSCFFMDF